MKDIRLLPIVLFAVSALLVLKVIGVLTGSGSFAIGAGSAVAAGGGHEAPAPAAGEEEVDPLGPPLDLGREYREMEALKKAAAAKEGHGEAAPAEGHGEAPAGDGHGEAAPGAAADGHAAAAADGHAAPAADGHAVAAADGHAAAAADGHAAPEADGHAAPAGDGHAAPAADGHAAAAGDGHAAPAGDGHAAPAADGHAAPAGDGHAAPAGDGHGSGGTGEDGAAPNYSTQRPEEFQPMRSPSELALEKALAERRQTLDQREEDITIRLKLLEAAEGRLQARLDEMRALQEKFDAQAASSGSGPSEQIKGLVSMYENMKPKAAAAVFNQLDLPILIELSKSMNPRKMSAILAVMNPDRASNLTTALAAIGMTQQARSVPPPVPSDAGPATTQSTAPIDSLESLPKIMPAAPMN